MAKEQLKLTNLHASVDNTKILKGLSLMIDPGETHVIMGPNGSGKSTLSRVLAGDPSYEVNEGQITFSDKDLLEMEPSERASSGLFLSFQQPLEVPGLRCIDYFYLIYTKKCEREETKPLEIDQFKEKVLLPMMSSFSQKEEALQRSFNDGFSGGEKKKNEILQMRLLNPKLVILDEIDSGLDVDALRTVSNDINQWRKNSEASLLIITHYNRILEYIEPDVVHIMKDGQIAESGTKSLAIDVEKTGYTQ